MLIHVLMSVYLSKKERATTSYKSCNNIEPTRLKIFIYRYIYKHTFTYVKHLNKTYHSKI